VLFSRGATLKARPAYLLGFYSCLRGDPALFSTVLRCRDLPSCV